MLRRIITEEIAEFIIWIVEITAPVFFDNDRASAFRVLNERKIWHLYINNFETKRNLSIQDVISEVKELLEIEKIPSLLSGTLHEEDTKYIKAIVQGISKKYNWNYSVTLDRFYNSSVCRVLSDTKIGLSGFAPEEVLTLFEQEALHKYK